MCLPSMTEDVQLGNYTNQNMRGQGIFHDSEKKTILLKNTKKEQEFTNNNYK